MVKTQKQKISKKHRRKTQKGRGIGPSKSKNIGNEEARKQAVLEAKASKKLAISKAKLDAERRRYISQSRNGREYQSYLRNTYS
jgi:hypothetical protein